MEQGNQLLEGAVSVNDKIADENKLNTQDYHKNQKTDKNTAEGEEWYHGVRDALGGHGVYQGVATTRARMASKSLSYGGLAAEDIRTVGSRLGGAGADLAQATVSSAKGVASSLTGGLQKAGQVGKNVVGSVQKLTGVAQPVEKVGQTSAEVATDVASKTATTGGKTGSAVLSGTEAGIEAGGEAGFKGIAKAGLGKALGNIGGGIDIVKDFDNIGKKGGFFGGTGGTTGDEVSNALTVGGTVLDIASFALPFLAPIAAGVQIAGAIDGTYQSVKDSQKTASDTKGSYEGDVKSSVVPPSLAGVGFLASQATDSHKLIGGTSSF